MTRSYTVTADVAATDPGTGGTPGGSDWAELYGWAGADEFYGHEWTAPLHDAALASYLLEADGFANVAVWGSRGTSRRTLVPEIYYDLTFHDLWTGDPWP